MYNVYDIRKQFPMLNHDKKMQGEKLVFLDNCSTTFKPQCVINEITRYYTDMTSNSHRGDYDLCYDMDVEVDKTRQIIANFINAKKDEVVFTSGTTMSINLVAYGYALKYLHEGDEILLSEAEHASNILPYFKIAELTGAVVKFIPLNDKGYVTPETLLSTISDKTKIVSLAHVSNVLGYEIDVKELVKITHRYQSIFVLDGAQSVPHMKVDFKDLDVDFLCFSAHKMCGPTGIGALVGKSHLLAMCDPFILGGGMNVKFNTCGEYISLDSPAKFEAGTQHLAGILGFKAAVLFLESLGMDAIREHEISLKKYLMERLKDVPHVTIYNKDSEGGILTFNVDGVFSQDEATLLNSKGIAVRSGQHCAKVLTDYLKTPGTVRASMYLYTTKEEVDALVEALTNGGDILDAYFK